MLTDTDLKIRFGGAQIPVTSSIKQNIKTLKQAIDWAAENKVDYLVTPEGSLSGYNPDVPFDDSILRSALPEIEQYASRKQVGLCLGTLWNEGATSDSVLRNQVRYYTNNGSLIGVTNKTTCTPVEKSLGVVSGHCWDVINLPMGDIEVPVSSLICADIYGSTFSTPFADVCRLNGAQLILHPTNAERGSIELQDQIETMWIESCIRRATYQIGVPILSVDNCYTMDGSPWTGETMTQSGLNIEGEWKVSVPRQGTQYFYYDFKLIPK